MTEEELGNADLHKIMPDTWQNIPWTIQSAIEVLRKHLLDHRRHSEQLQMYSMASIQTVMQSTSEFIQENEGDHQRIRQEIVHLEDVVAKRMKEQQLELARLIGNVDDKAEAYNGQLGTRIAQLE